jgi:hypothetical protein
MGQPWPTVVGTSVAAGAGVEGAVVSGVVTEDGAVAGGGVSPNRVVVGL